MSRECVCIWDEPGALQWRNPDCPKHGTNHQGGLMTRSDARKRRAEVKAEAKHDPTASLRRVLEQEKAQVARLTAERDDALAQVAAVAALADESRTHWHYEETWVVDQGDCVDLDDLLAALTNPATVLARRDAEKWDEGYSKGNLDGYFGTNNEKNPYRIEKGEQG